MPNQPAPRPTPDWAADFPKLREATDAWLFGDIWERSGLSKRDRSLITHATFYSGWPTGVQGAVIAKKVFESRGL